MRRAVIIGWMRGHVPFLKQKDVTLRRVGFERDFTSDYLGQTVGRRLLHRILERGYPLRCGRTERLPKPSIQEGSLQSAIPSITLQP